MRWRTITADMLALMPATEVAPVARNAGPAAPSDLSSGKLSSVERSMIEQALRDARHNKSKAAKSLGLTRAQLYVRMRRYGLA